MVDVNAKNAFYAAAVISSGNDTFTLSSAQLVDAEIDGGDGDDTLQLTGGGIFDLTKVRAFSNVEIISGLGSQDALVMSSSQLRDVLAIEGGGTSTLTLVGEGFNLTGKTIAGFGAINLESPTWGIDITVSSKEIALLVRPHSDGAKTLTLSGGSFTGDDLKVLYENGFSVVNDLNGAHYNEQPEIDNLAGSIRVAAQGRVLLDKGMDAVIRDDEETLASLSVTVIPGTGQVGGDGVDLETSGAVKLSNGMNLDSFVLVDDIIIGKISALSENGFQISFNTQAAYSRVEKVMHALRYVNSANDPFYIGKCSVAVAIEDHSGQSSTSVISVSVAPDASYILTEGSDAVTGTAADDILIADYSTLNAADQLDGGDGNDVLQSLGGEIDFRGITKFSGIEILRGSKTAANTFYLDAQALAQVSTIDGGNDGSSGGFGNSVILSGASVDLSNKTIINVQTIRLADDTEVTLKDKQLALKIDGQLSSNEHIILDGGTFTLDERRQLFQKGIQKITDASGTYSSTPLTLTGLDGETISTFSGLAVLVDATQDAMVQDERPLKSLSVAITRGYQEAVDSIGLNLSDKIVLSNGLRADSEVSVGGAKIGTFAWADNSGFEIEFNDKAAPNIVQELIRGIIYRNGNPGAAPLNLHEVTVTLQNQNAQFVSAKVTIDQYVYQSPTQLALDRNDIEELSTGGATVGTFRTEDPDDRYDVFTYTLIDDAGGRFAIQGNRLIVANGVKLDYEQARSHSVIIRVADKAGLFLDKTLIVSVRDVLAEKTNGSHGNDMIVGGAGRDTLGGGTGADTISGGYGGDVLTGGAGRDVFIFKERMKKSEKPDQIKDFSARDDSIFLENTVFKKLGSGSMRNPKKLNKAFFVNASEAQDSNDYIIYDRKRGKLYFDSDGSGAAKAFEIAIFKKGLSLTASDLFVV